ncbi:major facilitator superfamily domain-containing protein [Aspergillus ambiguus]|uniref:putative MFS transporter (Hol1) n=1 Tax=Aspergillus ambiguus TaxID=176160 RepID=UPI003CCE315F
MAFGILSPSGNDGHVGGTILLEVEDADNVDQALDLQKGTGKHAATVLVPQPSKDPNDPLRWPLWQRDLMFAMYLYCTILCAGAIGPLLSASAAVLTKEFDTTFTNISLLTGYNTCAVGAFGIILSALTRKYGKRPGYIFSMVCALVGTVWGGAAQSYHSLLGARIVQGFGVSMFESILFDVVGDLYYVHERGTRVAALTVALAGMACMPTVLSGLITTRLGWRWNFWMLNIFLGVGLLLVFFLGWETAFRRQAPATISTSETIVPMRKSFISRLAPFSGTYSDIPFWTIVIKPFLVLIHPAVIWSTLLLSISTAWFVVTSYVIGQIFALPPYNLQAVEIGYMSGGIVVGGVLGSIACGLMSDPIATALARKNNGIYEPEFRLVMVIPLMITSVLGWFLFGNLTEEGKSPAVVSVVWGVAAASIQFAMTIVGTYMVDAYRAISIEVFILGMVVKNFLFFGLSFGVNDWTSAWGPAKMFDTIGGIQLALCVVSSVVWVFGKKWRARFYAS